MFDQFRVYKVYYSGGIDLAEMEQNMGVQDREDKSEEKIRRKEAKRVC